MRAFALSALVLLALPGSVGAYGFADRLESAQVSPAVFEVISRRAHSPREYWCSAGAHARIELGASNADRVYLVRGRGPSATRSGYKSVQFTLNPEAAGIEATAPGVILNVTQVGDNLSVGLANDYCLTPPAGF